MDLKKLLKELSKTTIFYIIFAIFFFITFILIGFNLWILPILLLWIAFYLIFILKRISFSFIKIEYFWVVLIVLSVLSITTTTILKINKPKSKEVKTLTKEECAPIYEKYNELVFDISGENIKGTAGLQINPEDCRASVDYNFLVTANLTKNYTTPGMDYSEYYYVGGIREPEEDRNANRGTASIYPAYVDRNTLPEDPFNFGFEAKDYKSSEVVTGANTNVFYHGWRSEYTFYNDSLDILTGRTLYQIMDSSDYIIREEVENGWSSYTDTETAAEEGPIVKTIDITYTER